MSGASVIDAWAQPAIRDGFLAVPEARPLFEKSGSAWVFEKSLSADDTVALMDKAGVERLLLSAWHRPGRVVFSNDAIAKFVEAHPDRFAGVAAVDLEHPMAAVRELQRAVQDLHFVGLRVVPWLWKRPPTDPLYYPLFAACVELGVPFCTQVGHTGPLMPSETGRPVPYVDQVALDFPELKIVCGHIGHPWTEEMVGVAWKHANVFIDTSAYAPKYYPPALLHYMRSYGRDKVLFGTNWPQLAWDRCLNEAHELALSAEVEAAFLGGNAKRVFGL